jgi:hypothetical protein
MSEITQLCSEIEMLGARIKRLESLLASNPSETSLVIGINSAERRRAKLEVEFTELAASMELDVYRYRLINDGRLTLSAVSDAWLLFQRLFSVTFDAIKTGKKKQRARISDENAGLTAFGYGYSFSGSLGVTLTLPNERLLAYDTEIDQATRTVFALSKSADTDAIKDYAGTLGLPVIRAVYEWAEHHAKHGLGVGIEWQKNEEIRGTVLVQREELASLADAIMSSSEKEEEEITLDGRLEAADILASSFKFLADGASEEISGHFDEGIISESNRVQLPARYRATIRATSMVRFATEEEVTSYRLLKLSRI